MSAENNCKTLFDQVKAQMARVVVGQDRVIEQVWVALLSGGHVLLEGVPGTAKTLMVKAMARLVGCDFARIQFTPDMMPSDVVGTHVFDAHSTEFHLKKGPIFANVILADEINRTPPKTQAALLEAMEERQVTIEGERRPLPEPFMVLATQNPVEYEGTYPLPEAQLDRFLFKARVEYPSFDEEIDIARRHHQGFNPHKLDEAGIAPVTDLTTLTGARAEVGAVSVSDGILGYVTRISEATRRHPNCSLGASPRATVSLLLSAKALAAVQGRNFVLPDDIKQLAAPVLRHRLILRPEAEIEGVDTDAVVAEILAGIEVPR